MGGQSRKVRRERPGVQIVNGHDLWKLVEMASNLIEINGLGRSFEEDVPRRSEQAPACPKDQDHHYESGDRIGPVPSGDEDDRAGDRCCSNPVQIGEDVPERPLHVEGAAIALRQYERRGDVGDDSDSGHDDHESSTDVRRFNKSLDRLDEQKQADGDERDAIGSGGENLRTLQAIGHCGRGRSLGEVHRPKGSGERPGIGEHVSGVGEQCERMGEEGGRDFDSQIREDEAESGRQVAAIRVRCSSVILVLVAGVATGVLSHDVMDRDDQTAM